MLGSLSSPKGSSGSSGIVFQNTLVVDPAGSDSTGNGSVAAPYKTVAFAISKVTAPSTSNRVAVLVMPGQYTETGIALPPWTWVIGLNQGEHSRFTIISAPSIGLDTALWNVVNDGDQGGFANIRFGSAVAVVGPAASGHGDVVVDFTNCRFNGNVAWTYFSSGADIEFFNCILEGSVNGTHGAFYSNCTQFNDCTVALGGTCEHIGSTLNNVILTQASGITSGDPIFFVACNVGSINANGTGLQVFGDSISLPPAASITLAGGATVSYLGDCSSLAYAPATPTNWAGTAPVTVQEALDRIASKTPGA